MKFIALTFDYNFDALKRTGRKVEQTYHSKDFIFKYSAASYATFLYWNPEADLDILTDDPDLIRTELDQYEVPIKHVQFIEWPELAEYKRSAYAFEPAVQLVSRYKGCNEYLVKLDNDLVCKQKFPEPKDQVLIWQYERVVNEGKKWWGEQLVCDKTVDEQNFKVFNIGVLGLPCSFWQHHDEFVQLCKKMVEVDISSVSRIGAKVFHCCEQLAYCWMFHKHGYKCVETTEVFDHPYFFKDQCVQAAQDLRSKKA